MRLRWFLALSSLLIAVIGTTVVLYDRVDGLTGADDQVISLPGPADGSGAGVETSEDDPAVGGPAIDEAGYVEVGGVVELVHLEGATPDPPRLAAPLTIESERGFGNGGKVTGISVDGRPSTIEWDGGRPFALTSGPGLELAGLVVDLDEQGDLVCGLGRTSQLLVPGDHHLDAPVAVGSEGIATPYDSVDLTAGGDAAFTAHGDAAIRLARDGQHSFTGPGDVQLAGALEVTTEHGTQRASTLEFRHGRFELTFSPTEGGGWTVSGRVQSRAGGLVLGDG